MNKTSVPTTSLNLTEETVLALRGLIPTAFSEGKVDFEKLRAALGDLVDERPEKYTFTWAGKRDAIRTLQMPTRATLIPARDESVNFDDTQNLYIEGDNLEVLKLLAKSYARRVKMIYIDPPYNTGNDFVYPDDFSDPLGRYLQLTGQQDAEGNLQTSNPETSGRYHSAWLSMMYPRLFLARQLLRDDGVIFVSIDDHEVQNLRMLMNEIFGEENFIATIIWQKMYAPKSSAKHFSEDHDYVVVYAKDGRLWNAEMLPRTEEQNSIYKNPDNDTRGLWRPNNLAARNYYSKGTYSITCPGGRVISGPPKGSYWRISEEKLWELDRDGRIWWGEERNNVPAPKIFLSEVKQGRVPQTLWVYSDVGHSQEAKKEIVSLLDFENSEDVFSTPKPVRLIKKMLQVATQEETEDVVLDFFAGSSTTAQSVFEINREDGGNRRFILVQLPEPTDNAQYPTIAEIGKERIRRVIQRMKDERAGQFSIDAPEDLGFRVYKLAPSNFKPWVGVINAEREAYHQQMEMFQDAIEHNATEDGIVAELIIKHGMSLASDIEKTGQVYKVTDGENGLAFTVSFAKKINPEDILALGLGKNDLFICRDSALDDTAAANLALNLRLETI